MTETLPIDDLELCEPALQGRDIATRNVLGVPVHVLSMTDAIEQVNLWVAGATRPHLVTFVNVHMTVEARLRSGFRRRLRAMDLNCPDGAPVFWLSRRGSRHTAEKVSGPEFMPLFCEQSVALGHTHFLYGGAEGAAEEAAEALRRQYPGIRVVGHYCPPFRLTSEAETAEIVERINASGADVLWVCLGCPKQEQWMADMQDRLHAKVVLAVGQAFDLIAGRRQRAPKLLCSMGLEWAYRLAVEPRRLWKRYLVTNFLFVLFLLREKLAGTEASVHASDTFSEV